MDILASLYNFARECKAVMGTRMAWDANYGLFASELVINDRNDDMRITVNRVPPRYTDVWVYYIDHYRPVFSLRKSQVVSLKEACLKACGHHWLRIASIPDINRWLLGLPSHLINKITSFIPNHRLYDPDCIKFILRTNCTSLKLPRYLNTDFLPNFGNLTHLDIAGCRIPPDLYIQLVANLPKIKTLSLESTFAFNELLRILGDHSPNLESLNLKDNPWVTDEGIVDLCSVEAIFNSRYPRDDSKIETLQINKTKATIKGCFFAMFNLPCLSEIHFNGSFGMFREFQEKLNRRPSDMPFLIASLHTCSFRDMAIIMESHILLAKRLCPNVMNLVVDLKSISPELLPLLASFEKLNRLTLCYGNDVINIHIHIVIRRFVINFPSFLRIRGITLTYLKLIDVPANLNLIGSSCPNLVELYLKRVYFNDDPPIVSEGRIFQKVTRMEIYAKVWPGHQPTEEDLRLLLCNCTQLEHLVLRNVNAMKPELISEILLYNPMCNLESAFFSKCENVTGDCLGMLLGSLPSLKEVKVT